jgi:hypothetical protein
MRLGRSLSCGELAARARRPPHALRVGDAPQSTAGSHVEIDGPVAKSVGGLFDCQGWESEVTGDDRLRHDHRLRHAQGRVVRRRADGHA